MNILRHILTGTLLATALNAAADPITAAQARRLAQQLMPAASAPTLVKQATRTPAKARRLQAAVAQTAPYYIFSRGQGQGFVIVSGDDCLPSILGYTESGDFDEALLPPHLLGWLDHYAARIEDAQALAQNISIHSPSRAPETRYVPALAATPRQDVTPIVQTHWHQSSPYNDVCPLVKNSTERSLTGCVATAGAQVAYFFHKDMPDVTPAATPTYSYGDAPVTSSLPAGTPMKYDLMLNSYSGSEPAEYRAAVANYMYVMGTGTWLTYGGSAAGGTSGYIENLVSTFSTYFNLTSSTTYKSGVSSQTTWEDMIYRDLAAGCPVVYSGYKASENSGHAVLVDGYRAADNLWHFNFGWGGQGDGWYTVNDQTSMNGFNEYQNITYNVRPRKPNLKASASFPEGIYRNHTPPVSLNVSNNGTLDYSGFYVFLSSTQTKPTNLSDAKSSNTSTVVPNDGTATLVDLEFRPVTATRQYLYITDKNLNVLSFTEITPQNLVNDLEFRSLDVLGSSLTQQHAGADYNVVYGNKTTILATLFNHTASKYQDNPRLDVYESDNGGLDFHLFDTKRAVSAPIPASGAGTISFSLSPPSTPPLVPGNLYYAALRRQLTTSSETSVRYPDNVADTVVRFVFATAEEDLSATLDGRVLTFAGTWNATTYADHVKTAAFAAATTFDLRQVKHLGLIPATETAQKNRLYFVAEDAPVSGTNIIRGHAAERLELTVGYDYAPLHAFTAREARLDLNIAANAWQRVTAPVRVRLGAGVVAKAITSHTSTGISNKTELVDSLIGGRTYLVMTVSDARRVVSGTHVSAADALAENPDTAVHGLFVAATAPAGALHLDHESTQNFQPSASETAVEALRGYLYASDLRSKFRANSQIIVDPAYQKLGQAIETAQQLLEGSADILRESVLQALADSIARCEQIFSERPYTSSTDIMPLTRSLTDFVESCRTQYRDGIDMPIDMSGLIVNPSFERSATSTTTGSTYGWTAEGAGAGARNQTLYAYRGVGADGTFLLYSYTSATTDAPGISQTIAEISPGLYRLSAMVGSTEGNSITLFANDCDTAVAAHPFGEFYLTPATLDSIVVRTGETLTIGIRSGQWYKADDFRLVRLRSLTPEEDPVGISDVGAQRIPSLRVQPTATGLMLTTDKAGIVEVFTLGGTTAARVRTSGTTEVQLPAGIYIVRFGAATAKVLVR
jgi:hypothetical protein